MLPETYSALGPAPVPDIAGNQTPHVQHGVDRQAVVGELEDVVAVAAALAGAVLLKHNGMQNPARSCPTRA